MREEPPQRKRGKGRQPPTCGRNFAGNFIAQLVEFPAGWSNFARLARFQPAWRDFSASRRDFLLARFPAVKIFRRENHDSSGGVAAIPPFSVGALRVRFLVSFGTGGLSFFAAVTLRPSLHYHHLGAISAGSAMTTFLPAAARVVARPVGAIRRVRKYSSGFAAAPRQDRGCGDATGSRPGWAQPASGCRQPRRRRLEARKPCRLRPPLASLASLRPERSHHHHHRAQPGA